MNTPSNSGIPRLIVSRTLLTILAPEVPNLDESLAALERIGGFWRFPDRSILLEGMARLKFDELLNYKPSGSLYNLRHLRHHVFFRALAPFTPRNLYELFFPKAYNQSLGHEWFKVEMTASDDAVASEWKLEDLAITVLFSRRPNEKLKEQYASTVNEWLEQVSKQGIFGEGPVSTKTAQIQFQGSRAQLRIDASSSGQNTLNWFLLTLLHFGIEVLTVKKIQLAGDEYLDVSIPATGPITSVPILSRRCR